MPFLPNTEKDSKQKLNANSLDIPMPKHIPFPEITASSEIFSELILTGFTLASAMLQYINLYRTNWWMEESFVHHAVDVGSIKLELIYLIILVTTRRLLYLLILRVAALINVIQLPKKQLTSIKYCYLGSFVLVLAVLVIKMLQQEKVLFVLFLTYPLLIYFLIFGLEVEPFLRPFWEIEGAYFNGMPFHSCSSNATTIREEIDILKTDYNRRFKQIIFTSLVNAHYAGFVPVSQPTSHHYNVVWVGQHIFFVWLTTFMLGTVFLFPAKYCDVLHRASLHLGCWQKLDSLTYESENGDNVEFTTTPWNKNSVWTENSFVKYNSVVYRSLTPFTVSWPSNDSHTRFYKIFHTPELIFLYMFFTQGCIIMAHIILLFFSMEWNFMLSITFVAFTNQYTFFKIARDFLVTKKIYTAESSIANEKHND